MPGLPPMARTLAPPDALWLACVHRAVHHRDSAFAVWLLDIRLLAEGLDRRGWDIVAATAGATGTARLCAHGLDLAHERFGTACPADVLQSLRSAPGEPTAAFIGGMTEWRIQWWNLRELPTWRALLGLIAGHLVPPPVFMRERHGARGVTGLAWAYVRRLIVGVARLFVSR